MQDFQVISDQIKAGLQTAKKTRHALFMARLQAVGRNWQVDTHSVVSDSWQKLEISRGGCGAERYVYMSLCRFYSLPTRGLSTDGYLSARDLSSQKMITLVKMLWVFHTQRHTCPFLLKKEKNSQGSKQDASQPESHTASAVTHMSNTSSYSEIPQIWRKTRCYCSLLKQMESHSIRGPLCLSSCLWLCTWFEKEKPQGSKKKRLHFHLTQETRIPIPKWPKIKTDGFWVFLPFP